ncbi:hypothetical protein RMCBS344292_01823 [Rhizopus microsporus]|nr:hypothetical protein RMCBS344292_01823 [Rhizopus microsporus]
MVNKDYSLQNINQDYYRKAWYKMKGMSPLEAQKLYVDSLIQLLTELVHRYPHHQYYEFLQKSLDSLQSIDGEQQEEEIFQDAYSPADFETKDHFLNQIDPQYITQINSPPFYHKPYRRPSDQDYPLTPITSPGRAISSSHENYTYPADYLKQQSDIVSEADTLDREVAAATSRLSITAPQHSPYATQQPYHHHHHYHRSTGSASISSNGSSHRSSKKTMKKEENNRALEKLQTEVTALTEQIDRLRQQHRQHQQKTGWTMQRIVMTLLKHALADFTILFILFLVLWKKKSPIAYAILDRIMPLVHAIVTKVVRRVVFWKVTV